MAYVQAYGDWLPWINQNWNALVAGAKIEAPVWLAPMPASGFSPQPFASPEGQTADWTLSMSDRSRLHVHVFADGRRIVHRDKHDPDRGIGDMLSHLTFDTPYVVAGGLALLAFAASRGK